MSEWGGCVFGWTVRLHIRENEMKKKQETNNVCFVGYHVHRVRVYRSSKRKIDAMNKKKKKKKQSLKLIVLRADFELCVPTIRFFFF